MLKNGQDNILITRLNTEKATLLKEVLPLNYDEIAQIGIIGTKRKADGLGKIVIATGGTSDMTVSYYTSRCV